MFIDGAAWLYYRHTTFTPYKRWMNGVYHVQALKIVVSLLSDREP